MPLARSCTPLGATAPSGWRTEVESSDSPQPQRGRHGRVISQTAVARRLGGLSPPVCDVLFHRVSRGWRGSWAVGTRWKGHSTGNCGSTAAEPTGPLNARQAARAVCRPAGPASRYRSLSAGSANNLSVSARLLDRNRRNLREKRKICVVKPSDSPRRSRLQRTRRPENPSPLYARTPGRGRGRTSWKGDSRTCQAWLASPTSRSQAEGTSNRELRAGASSEGDTRRTATRAPAFGRNGQ
jgi:hypothetical protein